MTQRYCRVCTDWHDLDEPWPSACGAHHRLAQGGSIQIIKDIDPYKTAAMDKRTGKRAVIGGRAQHREFLRDNGYHEVGNDYVEPRREESSSSDRVADIKRAMNSL